MAGEIADVTADEIRLGNGNVIATLASDYRTLRGRTLLLAVLDEASFLRDEASRVSDIEAARALLPGLATCHGMLVVLSSPYRRAGLLFELYRDHFGQASDDTLVVAGPSIMFNPALDEAMIAQARADDPQAALSEWDGQFRSDLSQFLDDASIDGAVDHGRPMELPPPQEGIRCFCFVDMSGGGRDASTCCVAHKDGERIVVDAIRGRHGDPQGATVEYAGLARQYRCVEVVGDNYAKEWVAGAYRAAGVQYRRSPLVRSELYLEGQVQFTRGLISIPDNPKLLRELRLLERRTARSGKDSVDHGTHGSDDWSNSLFGAMYLASRPAEQNWSNIADMIGPVSGGPRSYFGDHPGNIGNGMDSPFLIP